MLMVFFGFFFFFNVLLVMFQSYVLFWCQESTSGCLQSYCVISLLQASMYNKVINICASVKHFCYESGVLLNESLQKSFVISPFVPHH